MNALEIFINMANLFDGLKEDHIPERFLIKKKKPILITL